MKQFFAIFIFVVYSVFTVGLNVLIHTCGGESESMIVTTEAVDPYMCGDSMPAGSGMNIVPADDCCSTEFKMVKIDESQNIPVSSFAGTVTETALLQTNDTASPHTLALPLIVTPNTSPPHVEIHIFNSVFLI